MPKNKSSADRPASEQIRQELRRVETRSRFGSVMRNTLAVLVSVAAIAVLIATFLLPVFRIYGSAMKPTVAENEIDLVSAQIVERRRERDVAAMEDPGHFVIAKRFNRLFKFSAVVVGVANHAEKFVIHDVAPSVQKVRAF